jgi:hypothetical protein
LHSVHSPCDDMSVQDQEKVLGLMTGSNKPYSLQQLQDFLAVHGEDVCVIVCKLVYTCMSVCSYRGGGLYDFACGKRPEC